MLLKKIISVIRKSLRKKGSNLRVLSESDLIDNIGLRAVESLISTYCCDINKDIENFLLNDSLRYEKRTNIKSRTYLVLYDYGYKVELCGFFTLINSPFEIENEYSKSYWKKMTNGLTNRKAVSAILIGQFGKNFNQELTQTISGKELLFECIRKISLVDQTTGLNLVYLECDDDSKLRAFYEANGFKLNLDKNGNPIKTGKNKDLLCYVAKFDDLKLETID